MVLCVLLLLCIIFIFGCSTNKLPQEDYTQTIHIPTQQPAPTVSPTPSPIRMKPTDTPQISTSTPVHTPTPPALTDEEFLDQLAQQSFLFFWHEANPENGLIKDRANNFHQDNNDVSSIASVGFGLSALCIGVENEWVSYEDAYKRAETTLRFFSDMPNEHGFYYHFVDMNSGERRWDSEVSSIDTALFLAGALTIAQCFPNTEVETLANEIYERVDFNWMLTDDGALPDSLLLNHGWKPESDIGFLQYRWDRYSELMILYLLAIGSPTHPIPAESWEAWERPVVEYEGYITFQQGPLFTHQYSQAWVDFHDKEDALGFNYFDSSIGATLANRQFAIDNPDGCQTYDTHVWGITAGDGPGDGKTEYRAYSAPPGDILHDCTVIPAAAAGSIVFTPEESMKALRTIYEKYGDRIWGKYGFSAAFNVDKDWWDQEVIGIDLGITLLMIENYRHQTIWKIFMTHSAIHNALTAVGLE